MTRDISFSVLTIDSDKFILVTCVCLENVLKILSFDYIFSSGVSNGIITSIKSATSSVIELVNRVEQKNSMNINNLYILMNNDEIFLKRQIESIEVKNAKDITDNDKNTLINKLYKEVSLENNLKVLEVIPIRYRIDNKNYVLDPLEMEGKTLELEADIVLASRSMLDDIYKAINKSYISILGVSYVDVVIKDICIFKEEREMGTLILNISIDYTNMIIVQNNNIVFSNRLNFGGNYLINDVMYCLKVSKDVAKSLIEENLYVDKESDNFITYFDINNDKKHISYREFYDILESRLEEILLLIKDKILIEKDNLFPYGIVLMGWTVNIKFVKNLVYNIFKVKARLAYINDKIIQINDVLQEEEINANLVCLSSLEYFYLNKEILNVFTRKSRGVSFFSNIKKQLERIL